MQERRGFAKRAWMAGRGQAMLEFGLALPILLVLVIGALDFGMAFHVKMVLENAAREGAYYTVYHTDEAVADGFASTRTAVQTEASNSAITIEADDIAVQCLVGETVDNTCPTGSTVVVAVSHELELLVDVLFHGPLQLTNEARMFVP